jgi:CRISPR-associated endonuclease/helicase Cas3
MNCEGEEMNLLAHLTNVDGKRIEQSLKEHCLNVAEYATESIGSAKLYHIVYLAGVLHDAGKAKLEFAEYLEKAYGGEKTIRGSVNHTFAGVIWLFESYHTSMSTKWERLTCEVIGYALGAHHGMFDCVDLDGKNGFIHRLKKDKEEISYREAMGNFLSEIVSDAVLDKLFQKAVREIEIFFKEAKESYQSDLRSVFFQISMLVRLVLAAVVYGDRRDTSEFMAQLCVTKRKEPDWKSYRDFFEIKIAKFQQDTPINQVRGDISTQCLKAASRQTGIYRLNVPTGGGKTLCTLRYALAHAERYHKKRIIFIIPLLSVLDQNAKVIREYVPDEDVVLEHHSNVILDTKKNGNGIDKVSEELDYYECIMENWNYPIIVSTLVQLLNILFSDRMSAVGRMQALCDSVIVIDEVQSLPKKVTVMFNSAMNFLRQYCNATIILSSATQPCFEELKWPLHFAENSDLVKLNREQLQIFNRVEVINHLDPHGMDWEECIAFCNEVINQHDSLLIICNTKAEAKILFEKLQEESEYMGWDLYHLSTSMCQEHRWNTFGKLKESMARTWEIYGREHKVICVSTQLIEAGVDLSFESVIRVLAGIDNLAQAAGRCNRNNEYRQAGKVYLIKLKNENLSMLKEIKNAQDSTINVAELWEDEEESLISDRATRKFYRFLFQETKNEIRYPIKNEEEIYYLSDLLSNKNGNVDGNKNKDYILQQPFKTIGKYFKVYDQNTTDILVPYGEGANIVEQLSAMQEKRFSIEAFRKVMKQARKYTISIYEWQKERLYQAGLLYSILEGRALVLDAKAYDDCFGLFVADEQAVDYFVL